ncbi:MAG: trehalose-phosphatase [Actinomycetota bacterium]
MTGTDQRLPEPVTAAGRAGLAALRAAPDAALLATDFDGTLAPIVADPAAARALPGTAAVLWRLAAATAGVAVVTGRPARQAARYAGLDPAPAPVPGRLVVLGQYGRERWDPVSGAAPAPDPGPGLHAARAELPGLLAALRSAVTAGVHVEDKPAGLAVHLRRTGDPAAALAVLGEPLRALAARHGLVVEPGRLVLELRPPGTDKGQALDRLVAETGAGTALFAGDDLGDLAAYDAVDRLRARGGQGLTVCSGSAEAGAVAARADLVLEGPAGVLAFLRALAADLEARRAPD